MNSMGAVLAMAGLMAIMTAGCASVGKEWKTAAAQTPPSDDISGDWDGTWLSEGSGHKGRLRCLMTKKSDTEYEAFFHATFWKIFSAKYTVTLQATRKDTNDFRLEGSSHIGGLMGGEYRYHGVASPIHFSASYIAEKDHGIFEMKRPAVDE